MGFNWGSLNLGPIYFGKGKKQLKRISKTSLRPPWSETPASWYRLSPPRPPWSSWINGRGGSSWYHLSPPRPRRIEFALQEVTVSRFLLIWPEPNLVMFLWPIRLLALRWSDQIRWSASFNDWCFHSALFLGGNKGMDVAINSNHFHTCQTLRLYTVKDPLWAESVTTIVFSFLVSDYWNTLFRPCFKNVSPKRWNVDSYQFCIHCLDQQSPELAGLKNPIKGKSTLLLFDEISADRSFWKSEVNQALISWFRW